MIVNLDLANIQLVIGSRIKLGRVFICISQEVTNDDVMLPYGATGAHGYGKDHPVTSRHPVTVGITS
jgi:hypothetical protein